MSKRDIITLVAASLVLGVAIYFIINLLSPPAEKTESTAETAETTQTVPAKVDDTAYKSITTLSDYGKPALSGIGKTDLFAGY